jgi:hypothetical protein
MVSPLASSQLFVRMDEVKGRTPSGPKTGTPLSLASVTISAANPQCPAYHSRPRGFQAQPQQRTGLTIQPPLPLGTQALTHMFPLARKY